MGRRKNLCKRFFAGLLAVVMIITGVPGNVFANQTQIIGDVSENEEISFDMGNSVSGSDISVSENDFSNELKEGDYSDREEGIKPDFTDESEKETEVILFDVSEDEYIISENEDRDPGVDISAGGTYEEEVYNSSSTLEKVLFAYVNGSLKTVGKNETIKAHCYDSIIFAVGEGEIPDESHLQIIDSVTVKRGKKVISNIAIITDEKYVTIDVKNLASDKSTDPVTVIIKGSDFGTKNVKLDVKKFVTSVSVKGAKNNKIKQKAGTYVEYDLTFNKNADLDTLSLVCSGGGYYQIDWDKEKKKLYVATYDYSNLCTDDFDVWFRDSETEIIVGKVFHFSVTKPALKSPSVTIKRCTDSSVQLSIKEDKSLKKTCFIYYWVSAKAVGDVSPLMKSEIDILTFAGDSIWLSLTKSETDTGVAQKYNITVTPVQIRDQGVYYSNPEEYGIYQKGKAVKISASTKNPCYEYALSLKPVNKSVIMGKEKCLATAVFSKKTTYYDITEAGLYDKFDRCVASSPDDLTIDNDSSAVYICKDCFIAPGKYTLKVKADAGGSRASEASMQVTLKAPANNVDLSGPNIIYKAKNKAASASFKAVCSYKYYEETYKSANTNVKWSLDLVDADIEGYVSINKKGVVTVKKGFNLNSSSSFYVTATCEYGDVTVTSGMRVYVYIDQLTPGKIAVDGFGGLSNGAIVSPSDIENGMIKVYGSFSGLLDNDYLSFSVKPKTGLEIDEKYKIHVKRPGTYTITAKAKDSGKKSVSVKFTVKSKLPEDIKISIEPMNANGLGTAYDPKLEFDPDNPTVGSVTGICEYLKISTYASLGNDLAPDNVSIKVKNADIIRKDVPNTNLTVLIVKPVDKKVEITISYTLEGNVKQTKKYTISVNKPSKKLTAVKKEYTLIRPRNYGMDYLTFKYSNKGLSDPRIVFSTPEAAVKKGGSYTDMISFLCSVLNEGNQENNAGSIKVESKNVPMNFPSGTYSLYATLCDKDSEDVLNEVTKPVKITVKVMDAPVPKATLNKKNIVIENRSYATTTIKFKEYKDVATLGHTVKLENYNNQGKNVLFSNYFSAFPIYAEDGTVKGIELTRSSNSLDDGVKQVTGWITYEVVSYDGHVIRKTELITVKFK